MACWLSETVYQMTVNSPQRWAWMCQVLLLTFHFSPLLRCFPPLSHCIFSLLCPLPFSPTTSPPSSPSSLFSLLSLPFPPSPPSSSRSSSLPLSLHFYCSHAERINWSGRWKPKTGDTWWWQCSTSRILKTYPFILALFPGPTQLSIACGVWNKSMREGLASSACKHDVADIFPNEQVYSISPMFKTLTRCSIAGWSGLHEGRQGTTNEWGSGGGGGWECQMCQVWFITNQSSLIDHVRL